MNLQLYRAGLKSYSDYAPTNQTYDNELDAYVNLAYWYIWTQKRWNFSQRQIFFQFYPDITSEREGGTALSVLQYTRLVAFSAPVNQLDEFWNWEGQPIEISGQEYKILKIVDSSTIQLAEPYRGAATNTSTDWIIKHRYYYLPEDCMELLYIGHRDAPVPGSGQGVKGKAIPVSPRNEESINLREDRTSDYASAYIPTSPINIPPGEKIGLSVEQVELLFGTIPSDYHMELCWAFEGEGGRVGPLSKPEIISTGTAEQGLGWQLTVSFLSHDEQAVVSPAYSNLVDTHPNPYEGLRKRMYFNQNFNHTTGERLGNPVWREVRNVALIVNQYNHLPARADDLDSTYLITSTSSMNASNPRYIETDGQHLRIRPWPRIDSYDFHYEYDDSGFPIVPEDYALYGEMRYIYKPHQLATDTDSPEMPYEFHELVMWATLIDVYRKHGDLQSAEMYERRVEKRIKQLERRYTDYVDSLYRKGRFSIGSPGTVYDGSVVWHNGTRYTS